MFLRQSMANWNWIIDVLCQQMKWWHKRREYLKNILYINKIFAHSKSDLNFGAPFTTSLTTLAVVKNSNSGGRQLFG